jgi:HEAT repeat protein
VALEQGTGLVVLVRVVDREIERIRAYGDNCRLDAGGRTVQWLAGITPAESLSFLEGVIDRVAITPSVQHQLAASAVSAISLHDGAAAEAVLDRIATSSTEMSHRRTAIRQLARERGARGFERVRQLLSTESSPDVRVALVEAIALTRQPQTAEALLAVARSDPQASVRRTAAYWYPQRAGAAGLDATLALIRNDADEDVRVRALAGLTRLPADVTVPHLIELVRTSSSQRVRRESVAALGRTKDPRAIEFLASLIRSTS